MLWITHELLPVITMVAYFAIAIRVVTFRREHHRHKRCYSAIASFVVGSTMYAGVELLAFKGPVSLGQCIIVVLFLAATLRFKGNVAALLRPGNAIKTW